MPVPVATPSRRRRLSSRGQSLVEFALVVPVLLLLLLVALDFGRVYLGWVNVQQMARVAANFAADHALTWPADRDEYRNMILNDARKSVGCTPPAPTAIPDPVYTGTGVGQHVSVTISCEFGLITPVISGIVGDTIEATGSATFPVKEGIVGSVPGGGGAVTPAPTASFDATPRSGWGPLTVTFTDTSTNAPADWAWDFSVSSSGSGSVSPGTASGAGPHTVTYDCAGTFPDVCTFGVRLTVENAGGSDSHTETAFIEVHVLPTSGPVAEFTATPLAGTEPLNVDFSFVDVLGGAITYDSYDWDFGDGSAHGSGPNPSHTYANEGIYDVTLTVTSGADSSTLTKPGYITVERQICIVPDFQNKWRFPQAGEPGAQAIWEAANFTTTVVTLPNDKGQPGGNYKIQTQTLVGGTIDPQPLGCDSEITLGP